MPGRVKQRDISDCGAACLASVAMHYQVKLPVSRIRQMAGTDQKGTNVLGLIEAAQKMGFAAKGVKGEWESLFKIPKPAIAHLSKKSGLQHYVVICRVTKRYVKVMDPADGKMHKYRHDDFKQEWSGILILLMPSAGCQQINLVTSNAIRFKKLLSPHKAIMIQALLGAVLFALLGLASAVYVGKIVDHVLPSGNINLLNLLGLAMIMVIAFRMLLSLFQMQFLLKTGQKLDATLVLGYYRHVMHLPQSFFDSMRVGEIISRVNDAMKVRFFISDIAINLVVNSLILVVSFVLMFSYYWKLAMVMLLVLPLYGLVYAISNALNKKVQRRIMERAADLESQMVESLGAMTTIRRNSLEWFANLKTETRFSGLLAEIYTSGQNNIFTSNATSLISQVFTVVLLWVGAKYTLDQQITPGELLSFYAVLGYFIGPVAGIIGVNRSLQDALIASDRLFEMFDLQQEKKEGSLVLRSAHMSDIRFVDVGFRYGSRAEVFNSLQLQIPCGNITAVVGESGSGKSTLAALLQRIYPIHTGNIYIGKYNIELFALQSLRQHIAAVPQKIDIFSGSIAENIALGDLNPDMERIIHVCHMLGFSGFVEQLPQSYFTLVGENGAAFSGGQKQMIAIARALYRNPEMLILDEATASLDRNYAETVCKVISDMRDSGKTILLITHNLQTIEIADKVVLLDQGQVLQEGSPKYLSETNGKFRDMFFNPA